MTRTLLPVLLFLMIFGPKVSGWLDVLSLVCAGFFGYYFLAHGVAPLPVAARRSALLFLLAMLLLFGFAAAHYLAESDPDPYQTLRFGRVLLNFAGVVALVSAYWRAYGSAARQVLPRQVYHCLVVHAAIMLAICFLPPVRDLVVNQLMQVDPESQSYLAKVSGYRISGLTDSWDALSGLQGLGLLMLPILMTRQTGISATYATVSVPMLLFAVAISGRTGFVTTGLLLPVSLYFSDLRRVHRGIVVTATLLLATFCLVEGGFSSMLSDSINNTSISRSLAMFGIGDPLPENQSMEETIEVIREHYFLPDSWRTLMLGTGGSGRDVNNYVPADNGWTLNLHNLGLLCFTLMYGILAWMLRRAMSVRATAPATCGFCVLTVVLILLIDTKVAYAYSRNGFTIMMVMGVLVWCEARWPQRAGATHRGYRRATVVPRPAAMRPSRAGPVRPWRDRATRVQDPRFGKPGRSTPRSRPRKGVA